MSSSKDEPNVFASLQKSGFPFQIAIDSIIMGHRKWTTHATEFPWVSDDGRTRFLDLIAHNGNSYLTIECKKVENRAFAFLRPESIADVDLTSETRIIEIYRHDNALLRLNVDCITRSMHPMSFASEFCVMAGDNRKDKMLEADTQELVRATDVFARWECASRKSILERNVPFPPASITPVLVTNARLFAPRFESGDVSLTTGRLEAVPEDMPEVHYVRFSKTFPASDGVDTVKRTVFVVNAMHFDGFLGKLETRRSSEYLPNRVCIHRN